MASQPKHCHVIKAVRVIFRKPALSLGLVKMCIRDSLTLDKKYSRTDIDKACFSALELSQVNLKTVRQLLTIMATPKKNNNATAPALVSAADGKGGRFARPMSDYKKHLNLVYSKP